MSGWTKIRNTIQSQKVRGPSMRVLLVEGPEDEQFFGMLLDQRKPGGWQNDWAVASAGGKRNLLDIVMNEPSWIGVMDQDEGPVQFVPAGQPANLLLLPRFCLESYFVEDSDLWSALPEAQRAKVAGGQATLAQGIGTNLGAWLRHGALWRVVNPLWGGLRALGFKDELLDSLAPSQTNSVIQQKLQTWYTYLDPPRIMQEFQTELGNAQNQAPAIQLRTVVHGKMFFHQVVNAELNRHIGSAKADDRVRDLIKTCPLPPDLLPIWQAMGV